MVKNPHELLGVPGTLTVAPAGGGLFKKQEWVSLPRQHCFGYLSMTQSMTVTVRFDDRCRNGHNSFSVTAEVKDIPGGGGGMCGSIHDEIVRVFPELEPLIKWHSCAPKGPLHYLSNTLYLAGDRDSAGLRKGERRQMLAGGKDPMWNLRADATGCQLKTKPGENDDLTCLPIYRLKDLVASDEPPTVVPRLFWEPCWQVGEGKEREFDAARRAAVWPEATDEQLSLPREELRQLLEARLPQLIEEFRVAVESAGLAWEAA